MKYNEYTSKLEKLKAEQAVIIQNNQKFCEQLETLINNYEMKDCHLASAHDVNLNILKTIDVARITTDKEYLELVKVQLKTEIEKIDKVLSEVLV